MGNFTLKLTAAIVIDGEICKAGELVELSEVEARNLLSRGKAELHGMTEADEIDLSKLNKTALQELAKSLEIEFTDADTKAQLIAAIEAKQAEDENDQA